MQACLHHLEITAAISSSSGTGTGRSSGSSVPRAPPPTHLPHTFFSLAPSLPSSRLGPTNACGALSRSSANSMARTLSATACMGDEGLSLPASAASALAASLPGKTCFHGEWRRDVGARQRRQAQSNSPKRSRTHVSVVAARVSAAHLAGGLLHQFVCQVICVHLQRRGGGRSASAGEAAAQQGATATPARRRAGSARTEGATVSGPASAPCRSAAFLPM